jgi:hypothetical protein
MKWARISGRRKRRIMRKTGWLAALLVICCLGTQASAQTRARSSFGAISSGDLKFTPVDTTKQVAAPVGSLPTKNFKLANYFSSLHLPAFLTGPHFGTSPLPPASSYPSTHYKNFFPPVMPITPGK